MQKIETCDIILRTKIKHERENVYKKEKVVE